MEPLSKLFGTPARVKLLRLFLFNPEGVYGRDDVVEHARVTPAMASKELAALARMGIIKRRTLYKEPVRSGGATTRKRKTLGWILDPKYTYREALRTFLHDTLTLRDSDVRKRFMSIGPVRVCILSGFLVDGDTESELDVLLVGNALASENVETVMRGLEAECGREIRYAVIPVEEYQYRLRVRDKMLRNIVDYPHTVLVDKVGSL